MPRILIMTGLWIPVIGRAPSDGAKLVRQLAKRYPKANLTWHSWWETIDPTPLLGESPLILIGHSFGGHACIRLAKQFAKQNKTVDELLLLDPVPTDFKGRWTRRRIEVPDNVSSARCVARTLRLYPRSKIARGANVTNETRSIAHDRFMQHSDIVGIIETIVKRFA